MGDRPKRESKAVDTFTVEEKEVKEFVITAGAGAKLGDIENVKIKIDKLSAASDELKKMHQMCFGRPGKATVLKKNLREFSGLTVEGVELERKEAAVAKLDGKMLKTLLQLCDLSTTGTKKDNVDAFLAFLKEPADSGKKSLAVKAGEKRARAERKKAGAGKKGKKGGKAKGADGLKRPLSAYMLYCNNKRDKVKAENPEASMIEVTKLLAEKWKGISDERRAKYEAEAAALKAEYDKKKAAAGKPPAAKKQKVGDEAAADADEDDEEGDDDEEEGDEEGEGGEEGEEEGEKGDEEEAAADDEAAGGEEEAKEE